MRWVSGSWRSPRPGVVGAASIEVAETNGAEAAGAVEPVENLFHHDFGFPVRVNGVDGFGFRNRGNGGIAVDGGSGGEHEFVDACFGHGGEERDGAAGVVVEVLLGLTGGFADGYEGGEVDHGVDLLGLHEADELRAIKEGTDVEDFGGDTAQVAFGEIVNDGNFESLGSELINRVRADVARAAGNEYFRHQKA